jgi:hypothetical protein
LQKSGKLAHVPPAHAQRVCQGLHRVPIFRTLRPCLQAAQKSEFLSFGGTISYPRRGLIFCEAGVLKRPASHKKLNPQNRTPPHHVISKNQETEERHDDPRQAASRTRDSHPLQYGEGGCPMMWTEGGGKGSGGGRASIVILVAGWRLRFWGRDVSMKL